MSMKETQLPAYNPAMPDDEKEKVIQESLRQIGQAMMATGAKSVASKLLTKAVSINTVKRFVGDLTASFVGSNGFTQFSVRVPFTLAGGAAQVRGSLWLDGNEIDRNVSSSGQLLLQASALPPAGNHTLQVQLSTDAGTASLFGPNAWGQVAITETML